MIVKHTSLSPLFGDTSDGGYFPDQASKSNRHRQLLRRPLACLTWCACAAHGDVDEIGFGTESSVRA